jgi:curved DNA-binding protein
VYLSYIRARARELRSGGVTVKDYYKILGVSKTASVEEIKRAFKTLAKKHHPDLNKGDKSSEEKFKKINEAYAVLSDPEKRKQFDTFGAEGFQQRYSQEDIFRGADFSGFEEIFGGGSLSDLLSGLFGKGRSSRTKTQRRRTPPGFGESGQGGFGFGFPPGTGAGNGQPFQGFSFDPSTMGGGFPGGSPQMDAEAEVPVPLRDAFLGTTRRLNLQAETGEILNLDVKIPGGTRSGQKLRLRGKGAPGPGGQRGDLLLTIRIQEDPALKLEGDDVVAVAEVPVWTLALGGKVEVLALDGVRRAITVAEGTQNGARLRIRGQGFGSTDGRRGDLYVELKAVMPANLTPRQKTLFEQLRDASN